MLEEQAFDAKLHDRTGFHCGAPELDDYLQRFAAQHVAKGVSSVYVLVDSAQPTAILGFYTLSAAQVDASQLNGADRKKLPRYPVPCFRMGRLASHTDKRGKGIGKILMGCAVDRCLKARSLVGAFALLEGCVAAFVYIRAGLLGATLTHGLAIAALATGLV